MARDTQRSRGGHIFIHKYNYTATWKILITDENTGVETDVTDYVISLDIDWPLSNLASATIRLSNLEGQFLDMWNGGEKIEVWAEYGDVAVPQYKIYRGKLDNVYYSLTNGGYVCNIDSRQTPELSDKTFISQFDNALITDAIKQIVDDNYTGIVTYNNVEGSDARVTTSFIHSSGIDALKYLAQKANMDLYIDTNNDINLFTKQSRINAVEQVNYEQNLISLPRYGKDNTKVYNRVMVYGKEDNNIIILKTEEDTASQEDLWTKDLVLNDSKLTTMSEVQDRADTEISNNTNIEEDGSVQSLGMPQVYPGDMMTVHVPLCGVTGYHKIAHVRHSLSNSGFLTNVDITDKQDKMYMLFKERVDAEDRLTPYSNLNDMTDSYNIFFDETVPIVTMTNCEIVNESLRLTSGQTSGDAISDIITADGNVIQCELRIVTNFPNHELCTFYASNNGGSTWEEITPGTLHTFSSGGSELAYKVNLVSDDTHNPVFEALCLLYKIG